MSGLPLCDTTMTPRLSRSFCVDMVPVGIEVCGTYEGNLGPCQSFEEGMNMRCVYCDHAPICHPVDE